MNLLLSTRKTMEEGLENGEVEELKFKKELIDVELPKINKEAAAVAKQLEDERFSDPKTDMEEAANLLDQLGKSVESLKERGKALNRYQDTLDLEQTPFESVDNVKIEWNLLHKLWKGMVEWREFAQTQIHTKFKDIEVETITKTVEKYDKASMMCAVNLKENPVTEIFKNKVEELKCTIPVVTYL